MEQTIIRELEPNPQTSPAQDVTGKDPEEINDEQDSTLRIITNNLHRLNDSIVQAVEAGLTVEIKRASRYHGGTGNWGDQIFLAISKNG